jgi:hypothetical protein
MAMFCLEHPEVTLARGATLAHIVRTLSQGLIGLTRRTVNHLNPSAQQSPLSACADPHAGGEHTSPGKALPPAEVTQNPPRHRLSRACISKRSKIVVERWQIPHGSPRIPRVFFSRPRRDSPFSVGLYGAGLLCEPGGRYARRRMNGPGVVVQPWIEIDIPS